MAPDKPDTGAARGGTERIESFPEEDEYTSPGVDPEVQKAMEGLKRAQDATNKRVSDITQLLIDKKKNTPVPAPH
jgi:hypothetical protein